MVIGSNEVLCIRRAKVDARKLSLIGCRLRPARTCWYEAVEQSSRKSMMKDDSCSTKWGRFPLIVGGRSCRHPRRCELSAT